MDYDYVIVMDSDGEDRPVEIKELIKKIIEKPEKKLLLQEGLKDLKV